MILRKGVEIGTARLCYSAVSSCVAENFKNSGDGTSFQLVYFAAGSAQIEMNHDLITVQAGQIYDFEKYMGFPCAGKAGEDSVFWVAINPDPFTKRFDHQLIRGGEALLVVGDDKERVLVALVGAIKANGKTIRESNFASIKNGQQVNVQVPEDSVAIVLTTR